MSANQEKELRTFQVGNTHIIDLGDVTSDFGHTETATNLPITASEAADESNDLDSLSTGFAAAVLRKFKQLLKSDLTVNESAPHNPETEQRSSDTPDDTQTELKASEATAESTETTPEEKTEMAQDTNTARTEAISKLVANEFVAFEASDADWLAKLDDEAFARIEVIANAQAEAAQKTKDDEVIEDKTEVKASDEKPVEVKTEEVVAAAPAKPKTAEEYIAALGAPPEITRMFERAIAQEKERRSSLIKTIKSHGSNKFGDKALAAMDTDMLEQIAAFATPQADFSGAGVHTVKRASAAAESKDDNADEPVRMPGLSFLRAAKEKNK